MSIAISKPRQKRSQQLPERPPAAVPEFPVARMTVPEYLSLVENGFFGTRRVELWEGWVIDRMSHGTPSARIISIINRWLGKKLPDHIAIRPQLPIQLKESCPEPDLAIVDGPESIYDGRHPRADEVNILIEVSDSSLENDRTIKIRMYAGAGIQEYWIVNCEERQVEVYTDPHAVAKSPQYRKLTTYLPGQSVPIHIAGKKLGELAVKELFPTKK